MSLPNFVQADLRFLLPVQAEQRVAILGYMPELAEAIKAASAHCTLLLTDESAKPSQASLIYERKQITGESLPLKSASMDHFFVPLLASAVISWLLPEVTRVLRPGGWLFLGVRNRFSLHQIRLRQQGGLAFTLSRLKGLFPTNQWQNIECYGVHEDLQSPQYLVPLATSGMSQYFYDQVFIPHSQAAAWGQRLALYLSQLGGQRFLFRDLGLVAQRL